MVNVTIAVDILHESHAFMGLSRWCGLKISGSHLMKYFSQYRHALHSSFQSESGGANHVIVCIELLLQSRLCCRLRNICEEEVNTIKVATQHTSHVLCLDVVSKRLHSAIKHLHVQCSTSNKSLCKQMKKAKIVDRSALAASVAGLGKIHVCLIGAMSCNRTYLLITLCQSDSLFLCHVRSKHHHGFITNHARRIRLTHRCVIIYVWQRILHGDSCAHPTGISAGDKHICSKLPNKRIALCNSGLWNSWFAQVRSTEVVDGRHGLVCCPLNPVS